MVPTFFKDMQGELQKGPNTLQGYAALNQKLKKSSYVTGPFSNTIGPKALQSRLKKKPTTPKWPEPNVTGPESPELSKHSAETAAELVVPGPKNVSPFLRSQVTESLKSPRSKVMRDRSSLKRHTNNHVGSMQTLPGYQKPSFFATSNQYDEDPGTPCSVQTLPGYQKPSFFATSNQQDEIPDSPGAIKGQNIVPASVKMVFSDKTKDVQKDFGALFE